MPLMEDGFDLGTPRDVIPEPTRGTLPFAALSHVPGREYVTWLINPTILLPKLVADLRAAGATFERRDCEAEADVRGIDADIIINCTGLGAKSLFDDTNVVPIRGQLVILQNPKRLKYMFSGGCGSSVAYLFARQDDIIVGGTYETTVDTPETNEETCQTFLARMAGVFNGCIRGCNLANPSGPCADERPS